MPKRKPTPMSKPHRVVQVPTRYGQCASATAGID